MVAERAQAEGATDDTYRQQFIQQWRTGWTALPHDVLFRDDLTMGDLKVYMALASFCWGGKRDCHPSRQLLMDMAGLSGKTTSVAIAHLEGIGWVRCKRGKNRQDGNSYVLTGPLVPLAASPVVAPESCEETTHGHVKGLPLTSEETTHGHVKGLPIKQTKIETDELKQKDGAAPHGAGAPPPVTARKQPKQTRPARPPKPPSETTVVAEAWMRANKVDPKKAMGKTVPSYRAWSARALTLWPAETILGCLSHMASKRHHDGVQFTITPTLLSQRIGEWEELPGKPTTYQEPSQPARSNGHRRPPDEEQQEAALFEERKAHFAAKRGGNLVGWDSYDPPPRQS